MEPEADVYTMRLGIMLWIFLLMQTEIEYIIISFTDRLLFRPSLLQYFQHQKSQIIHSINSYFDAYIHNHDQRTRTEILRSFYIFLERANEYEAVIPNLIVSAESFESVRETIMTYVAHLIDLSNEIIDMIMRGVPS